MDSIALTGATNTLKISDLNAAVGMPYTGAYHLSSRMGTAETNINDVKAKIGWPYLDPVTISNRL